MSTQALALRATTAPRVSPWAALPVIVAGAFMVVLDFFIVNVALPSIALDLGAGTGALEWIVAGYGLSVAAFLITAGRLGDRHGRRNTYALGVGLFTIASLGCGLAPTVETLVAARVLQGVAGALVMPQVLAIIGVAFHGEERARATGIYSMALGVAALGGQLIGGLLLHADVAGLGWRACFLINVPIGIAAVALTFRLVPDSRASRPSRLDLPGTALVTAAIVALVLPLIEGRAEGWPWWTSASFAAAAVLGAAFVAHQRRLARRGGAPLLDPSLFADRAFSAGLATQLLFWCGQAAFFVVLALFLQDGRGLSPLDAGLVFTIAALTYVAASGAAADLAARFGRGVPLAGGLVLAAGHGALALAVALGGTDLAIWTLAPGLALIGAGMGFSMTSLNAVALATLDGDRAGAAAGVLATVQELGNALGVAVTGVLFFGLLQHGIDQAFAVSLLEFAGVGVAIAALSRLLPAGRAR